MRNFHLFLLLQSIAELSDLNSNHFLYNIGKVKFFVDLNFLPIIIQKLDPTMESETLSDAKFRQIQSQTSFLSIKAVDPIVDVSCSSNVIEVVWSTPITKLWGKENS